MRVLLTSRTRDDSGAVAVLVGMLAVFLVGMSAFTADLGVAYINKRQIQTAADAAALGAAGVYSTFPGSSGCSTLLTNGRAAASAEAAAKVAANAAPASHVFAPTCDANALTVKVTVATDSPSFFGRLFGRDKYPVTRSATTVVGAASSVGSGMRPLALCSRDLLALTSFPTPVMKFEGPAGGGPAKGTRSDCPDTMNPGNWWTLRCPGETSNLATSIAGGCANPVSLVPGQPAPGSTDLASHLLNYCTGGTPYPESCLNSDPGNLRDSGSLNALVGLVDRETMFYMPTFCGTPACNPGAVTTDGGSNTIYPVFRLIAVRLCGFHLGTGSSGVYSKMTGICANNPDRYDASDGGPNRNYLLVSVQQINVSGGTVTSTCKIADPCDTGLREVRMTE